MVPLCALLALLALTPRAEAGLLPQQGGGQLSVEFQNPEVESRVAVVAKGIDAQLSKINAFLGLNHVLPGQVYFCEDYESFASKLQFEPPEWYNAVAQFDLRQIVVWVKPEQTPAMIAQLLNHELMHWAIFALPLKTRAQIPLWLHEGLAEMWSDRGLANTYQVSLAWEAMQNRLPRLSSYKLEFSNEPYRAAVGYALSKEFISHLRNNYGDTIFRRLFVSMDGGRTFDQALIDHTGLSVVSHEQKVRANLDSWWRVVQELYPHFFLIVVIAVLLLVPFVAARRRARRKALHATWQSEEDVDIYDGPSDNITNG